MQESYDEIMRNRDRDNKRRNEQKDRAAGLAVFAFFLMMIPVSALGWNTDENGPKIFMLLFGGAFVTYVCARWVIGND
jgi:hypothetical protein